MLKRFIVVMCMFSFVTLGCGKKASTSNYKNWEGFLVQYHEVVQEYITTLTAMSNENGAIKKKADELLITITQMQKDARKISENLSDEDRIKFSINYGTINAQLSKLAQSVQ